MSTQHLELEVLETSALDDVQQVSTIMNACIALGVHFSLVETIEHCTLLLQLGSELAQGYGIAKLIPACVSDWRPDNAWKV